MDSAALSYLACLLCRWWDAFLDDTAQQQLLLFLVVLQYLWGSLCCASSMPIEYFLGGQMREDLSLTLYAWKSNWTLKS